MALSGNLARKTHCCVIWVSHCLALRSGFPHGPNRNVLSSCVLGGFAGINPERVFLLFDFFFQFCWINQLCHYAIKFLRQLTIFIIWKGQFIRFNHSVLSARQQNLILCAHIIPQIFIFILA